MGTRRISALVVALAATTFTTVHAQQTYCASQPPPQGLVPRCQSRTMLVPDTKVAFQFLLTEWMRTCVSSDRAPELIAGASDSVDHVWELVQDRPSYERSVKIYPQYEPLTFTQDGRTCYGVKSVAFSTTPHGVIADDGDPTVAPATSTEMVTEDTIKEAAGAAMDALSNSSVDDNPGLSKFRGVLDGLRKFPKDLDDRYYSVAPIVTGSVNPPSCDKEYVAGTYQCLPTDKAVQACERHLRDELIQAYVFDKLRGAALTRFLEEKNSEISRSVQFLLQIQEMDEFGPRACNSVREVMKTKAGELARRSMSLYGYY